MRKVTKHIVHCSDSTHGNVEEITRWHKERGWRTIGYHFVILQDGTLEIGRNVDTQGAHCYGQNRGSVGTCLIGKKKFTEAQFATLRNLHTALEAFYGKLSYHGHREFSTKSCPNFDVKDVFEKYTKEKKTDEKTK